MAYRVPPLCPLHSVNVTCDPREKVICSTVHLHNVFVCVCVLRVCAYSIPYSLNLLFAELLYTVSMCVCVCVSAPMHTCTCNVCMYICIYLTLLFCQTLTVSVCGPV